MTDAVMIENTIPVEFHFPGVGSFTRRVDTDDDSFVFNLIPCNFTGFHGHPFLPQSRVPNEVYLAMKNNRSATNAEKEQGQ